MGFSRRADWGHGDRRRNCKTIRGKRTTKKTTKRTTGALPPSCAIADISLPPAIISVFSCSCARSLVLSSGDVKRWEPELRGAHPAGLRQGSTVLTRACGLAMTRSPPTQRLAAGESTSRGLLFPPRAGGPGSRQLGRELRGRAAADLRL